MANLIDITSNILSNNIICFDKTNTIDKNFIPNPLENGYFGILNFETVTCDETKNDLDFLFTIDCSGSMSDKCADGRSKMQHIIHTVKNMLIYFRDHPNIKANVTVNAFDVKKYEIIKRTSVNDSNIIELLNKIDTITPRSSTNIHRALTDASKEIQNICSIYPSSIINHIFMTDGEATEGSTNMDVLKQSVNTSVKNVFIGFGIEHDARLLNGISSVGESAYYFIDKLESSGLVYGEILHGIVHKLLVKCEITVHNGLIYNFKTNVWSHSLYIGDIISETNKTYNIISENPDECSVNIKGTLDDLVVLFPSRQESCSTDIIHHLYRQRTLQMLYKVNDFYARNSDDRVEKKRVKTELSSLFEEIKKYIKDNDLEENKFLKNLCDDLYVCHRTFGTSHGNMFSTARQSSQGTQRIYTATAIGRVNDYQLSAFEDTPYASSQATQVMRDISRPVDFTETQEY